MGANAKSITARLLADGYSPRVAPVPCVEVTTVKGADGRWRRVRSDVLRPLVVLVPPGCRLRPAGNSLGGG